MFVYLWFEYDTVSQNKEGAIRSLNLKKWYIVHDWYSSYGHHTCKIYFRNIALIKSIVYKLNLTSVDVTNQHYG